MQTYYPKRANTEYPPQPWLNSLIQDVASALPGSWQYITCHSYAVTVADEESKLEIFIHSQSNRLIISQSHQLGPRNQHYFGFTHPTPQITVNPRRNGRSIAADITRRLLPQARAAFAEECLYMAQCYAYEEKFQREIRLLEQITGAQRCGHSEGTIYLRNGGEARMNHGGTVDLRLTLDTESAADILEYLHRQ